VVVGESVDDVVVLTAKLSFVPQDIKNPERTNTIIEFKNFENFKVITSSYYRRLFGI
jgi:hypothetical protein